MNLTVPEAKEMASIIGPLLKQGLSPYQILQAYPKLGISEKTMYNYIEDGVFREIAGISALDLRRQVSRKISKKKANCYKKGPTTDIFREGSIRIIRHTFSRTPMYSLHKWIPSITMSPPALSSRPLNL